MSTSAVICLQCGTDFQKRKADIKRSNKHFCCRDCSQKYNTEHKYLSINTVKCKTCNKEFIKSKIEISKTNNNFCSKSCAAKYNNAHRTSTSKMIEITCKNCGAKCTVKNHNVLKLCEKCLDDYIHREVQIICKECKQLFVKDIKSTKTLCDKCFDKCIKIIARKGGEKSVLSQNRRSKNEIYFAELCKEKFTNVTTNEPCFKSKKGNWDADVIIHELKIAILWNGAWHYKTISRNISLKKIQNRDAIKLKVIKENGYTPYIIKDMGNYNKKFVEEQFKLFIESIKDVG